VFPSQAKIFVYQHMNFHIQGLNSCYYKQKCMKEEAFWIRVDGVENVEENQANQVCVNIRETTSFTTMVLLKM